MPNYRRAEQAGGTFFLTFVTHRRMHLFDKPLARQCLREAVAVVRRGYPFKLVAIVLLPDHLHLILTLPEGESDYSVRISAIKAGFTRRWLVAGGAEGVQSSSRERQEYRGVWQKRFWEHLIRNEDDLIRCLDYIHYNPVKHRLAECPHAWAWSTFHRFVRNQKYESTWCCRCSQASTVQAPADIAGAEMD